MPTTERCITRWTRQPITERWPVCHQPIGSCRCGQDDKAKEAT